MRGSNATTACSPSGTNSSTGLGWSLDLRRLVVDTTGLACIGGTTQGVRGPVDTGEHNEGKKEDKENKNADLPRGHKHSPKILNILAIATVFQITALRTPPNN
jgi:hypothetical protein